MREKEREREREREKLARMHDRTWKLWIPMDIAVRDALNIAVSERACVEISNIRIGKRHRE
jgi:hypothetical protein